MSEVARDPLYRRHRFPAEIIAHAVWLYFRFPLSLRMVEDMLAARGIIVTHQTVRSWGGEIRTAFRPPYVVGDRKRQLPCSREARAWHDIYIRIYPARASIEEVSDSGGACHNFLG
ncbi:transposase-like protein [Rhizobium ruizarguesonis]